MDKPTECIICYSPLQEEPPLKCGHWMHMECVKKHFKPECPVCRHPLEIAVSGTFPDCDIEPDLSREYDYKEDTEEIIDMFDIDDGYRQQEEEYLAKLQRQKIK